MSPVTLCADPWLGTQLGCAVHHMLFAEGSRSIYEVNTALAPVREEAGVFVDATAPVRRYDLVNACAGAGMHLVDTNLRLERLMRQPFGPLRQGATPARDATLNDRGEVIAIARSCLRGSRFHRDPHIKPEVADALKGAWADNFFSGKRGDGMVVVDSRGRVAGFLLYLLKDAEMIIDLVAVAEEHRGIGLGVSLLVEAARQTGAERIITGTQLANVAAVGFYENMGFRLVAANHTFHFHGKQHENRTP